MWFQFVLHQVGQSNTQYKHNLKYKTQNVGRPQSVNETWNTDRIHTTKEPERANNRLNVGCESSRSCSMIHVAAVYRPRLILTAHVPPQKIHKAHNLMLYYPMKADERKLFTKPGSGHLATERPLLIIYS